MSLQPPLTTVVGEVWVDPITAHRFEWDGHCWIGLGPNADWSEAEKTKPMSADVFEEDS